VPPEISKVSRQMDFWGKKGLVHDSICYSVSF
jgi:hypothetical protein